MTVILVLLLLGFAPYLPAADPAKTPNILVIMGDDIRWFNPSIYHRGIMGYETPNIDRIGEERDPRREARVYSPLDKRKHRAGSATCSRAPMVRETLTTYSGVMPERHGSGTTRASALALALIGASSGAGHGAPPPGCTTTVSYEIKPQGHDHR